MTRNYPARPIFNKPELKPAASDMIQGAAARQFSVVHCHDLIYGVPSFPRRRESSAEIWIPACAGITLNYYFRPDIAAPCTA
jgi:hypothetical protein